MTTKQQFNDLLKKVEKMKSPEALISQPKKT